MVITASAPLGLLVQNLHDSLLWREHGTCHPPYSCFKHWRYVQGVLSWAVPLLELAYAAAAHVLTDCSGLFSPLLRLKCLLMVRRVKEKGMSSTHSCLAGGIILLSCCDIHSSKRRFTFLLLYWNSRKHTHTWCCHALNHAHTHTHTSHRCLYYALGATAYAGQRGRV